ncbi:MAG: hydrogenase formation protein HypD [Planctomycetota bacterium]|jgi:hydrogenase expression/formation protein HypD
MKFVDEYRDEQRARHLAARVARLVTRPWVLMEICGGQTHTILRYGLDQLLPQTIQLVHGPGCPVCVTPLEMIDKALHLASQPEVTFVSYGDMLRVPGSRSDLLRAKAAGADVRVVYSPLQALSIARAHPGRRIVFFAIGFETTAPANAMAVWRAKSEGLKNFSVLASHVLVPPAIRLLLASRRSRVQGLIAPGHVCTVMGYREYEALSREFGLPVVVGGFEPTDLLEAVALLVAQLEAGRAGVQNQYVRSVGRAGNRRARRLMSRVFEVCDRKWRGIGFIPRSGLRLRAEFEEHDAERQFGLADFHAEEPAECLSAEVLQGLREPTECPAFATRCTPQHPLGALMVSAEGACAAYYRYRGRATALGENAR